MLGHTIFDGEPRGDLAVALTCDVTRIDEHAISRGVNEMRRGNFTAVCERPDWSTKATLSGSGTKTWQLLGAGEDHDGVTPVAILVNHTDSIVRVIRGTGYTTVRDFSINNAGHQDMLTGQAGEKSTHAHAPGSAVICEGLIIVQCRVDHDQGGGNWQSEFEAYVYSNDLGATWQLVQTSDGADYPTPITGSLNRGRAARWSLQNYFPSPANVGPLLSAWICPADYLNQPNSPGGQGYLFRITRSAVGADWVVEPLITVPGTTLLQTNRHSHSAGVVEHDGVLHYIIIYGDGVGAELVRCTCSNPANYTTASWTTQRGFYGLATGTRSVQPAGIAPGPDGMSLLGSSDTQYGAIQKIVIPADASAKADVYVRGPSLLSTQGGVEGLHIHARRPHRRGGYVAAYAGQSASVRPHVQGPLYSADGEHWALLRNNLNTPCFLYGGDIICVQNAAASTLFGCARPSMWRVRRPLAAAPGGTNPAYASIAGAVDTGGGSSTITRTKLTKDGQGRFLWPAGEALAGQVINPQPPSQGVGWLINCSVYGSYADFSTYMNAGTQPATGTQGWRVYVMPVGTEIPPLLMRFPATVSGDWSMNVPSNKEWHAFSWTQATSANPWTPNMLMTFTARAKILVVQDVCISDSLHPAYGVPWRVDHNAAYTSGAHEKLSVSPLGCGAQWTVAVMAQVPDAGYWDQWQLGEVLASWPLFTIWGDANNYVEFSLVKGAAADAVGTLRGAVVSGGVSAGNLDIASVFASKGSLIAVCLTQTGAALELSAMVAGPPVGTATLATTLVTNPTAVLNGNAGQTIVEALNWLSV